VAADRGGLAGTAFEQRDAGGAAPDRKVLHEAEVALDVVDEPGAGHWAVTGHDHLRAQWLDDSLEDLDGLPRRSPS